MDFLLKIFMVNFRLGFILSFAQIFFGGRGGESRYWVAWSCHESSPSSLQVREGLGSDGSHAVLAGGDMDGWMPEPHIDIEAFFPQQL